MSTGTTDLHFDRFAATVATVTDVSRQLSQGLDGLSSDDGRVVRW